MPPVESPSYVLREYRLTMTSKSQLAFGLQVAGWGEEIQRRLEDGSTRFTIEHLNILLDKCLAKGSAWHRRFETAMVGED